MTKPWSWGRLPLSMVLLSMLVPGLSHASEPRRAGRKLHVGDPLPIEARQILETAMRTGDGRWRVGICVFTRPGQAQSKKLIHALRQLAKTSDLWQDIPVWEVITRPQDIDQAPVRSSQWVRVADEGLVLYDLVGLSTVPATFVLTASWNVAAYFPGYNASSVLRLRRSLGAIYPELMPTTVRPVSAADQTQHRAERLAWRLYRKGFDAMALTQLSGVTTLSSNGRYLLGLLHLRSGDEAEAATIFRDLLADSSGFAAASVGMGVIHFRAGRLDSSLYHLERARTVSQNRDVNYWTGRIYESLADSGQAMQEYRAALDRIMAADAVMDTTR